MKKTNKFILRIREFEEIHLFLKAIVRFKAAFLLFHFIRQPIKQDDHFLLLLLFT